MSKQSTNSRETILSSLYAFCALWFAGFLVMAAFRAQPVDDYVSRSEICFDLKSLATSQPVDFEGIMRSAVRSVSSPENVTRIVNQIANEVTTEPVAFDARKIISQLDITLTAGPQTVLAVSLNGRGGEIERNIVNLIANSLAIESSRRYDQIAVASWLNSLKSGLDSTKQVHLAKQIHEEIETAQSLLVAIRDTPSLSNPVVSVPGNQTEYLTREIEQLKAKHQYDDTHPEIVSRKRRLEALRSQLAGDADFRPALVPEIAASGDSTQKNPFFQTSERRLIVETSASSPDIAKVLNEIDLQVALIASDQLLRQTESTLDVQSDLSGTLENYFESQSTISNCLVDVHASTNSSLRPSRNGLPISMLCIPCLLAAMTTMFFDPLRERAMLRSVGDVAKSLGAEVIGQLPSELSGVATPRVSKVAHSVVRVAEYTSLGVLATIALVAFAKPSVAMTIFQQPLYGLSNWLSLVLN